MSPRARLPVKPFSKHPASNYNPQTKTPPKSSDWNLWRFYLLINSKPVIFLLEMQRLCTKLRSLASVSSSHRLLHPPPQSYHRHLHFAAASRKWNLNGSLLNTSSSLPIQLPSVAALSSSRLSQLPHSVRLLGFFCFVFCMVIRLLIRLLILFCMHEYWGSAAKKCVSLILI